MPAEERTEEDLMTAYVAGDESAFEQLFQRLAPWLQRLMELQLPRRDDARDLVQQAFLQFHRARYDFRPGARVRPWLVTIALNLKRGYFRRRKRRPEHPVADPEPRRSRSDVETPEVALQARRVREALGKIPPAQAEVIVLHYFGGLSYREIAQMVGVGLSGVKLRAFRGYRSLREVLDDQ